MKEAYRLMIPQSIETEWDKGSRPSGFAALKLLFEPTELLETGVKVVARSGKIWKLRDTKILPHHHSNYLLDSDLRSQILRFMPTFLNATQRGVQEALLHSLDKPVIGLSITLTEVTLDPVYSTEMAFYFAAKSGTDQFLKQALKNGLLEKA